MYDNAPEETRYIYTDFDSTGQRLTGADNYTVTFAKDQLPPVNGFWSLTLYNKEHLFEPNRLNRFSLGTKSKSLEYTIRTVHSRSTTKKNLRALTKSRTGYRHPRTSFRSISVLTGQKLEFWTDAGCRLR
jgi:Protein of unknown function (DUF1214)